MWAGLGGSGGAERATFEQTIVNKINAESIDWAFRMMDAYGYAGFAIDEMMSFNNAALQGFATFSEIADSSEAMNLIANNAFLMSCIVVSQYVMDIFGSYSTSLNALMNSNIAMVALGSTTFSMNIITSKPIWLNAVCKSPYGIRITTGLNATSFYTQALNACKNNSALFTRKDVSTINKYQGPTAYHNINADSWSGTFPVQNAIYFLGTLSVFSTSANMGAVLSYDKSRAAIILASSTGITPTAVNRFGIGTIGGDKFGINTAFSATSDLLVGSAYQAL